MKKIKYVIVLTSVVVTQTLLSQTKTNVDNFSKVIISPHIETTFVQGNEESVTILSSTEPEDKINIEVKGNTLRVYLDDAKEVTKNEKVMKNGLETKIPIYKGKVLTILVTYKSIGELSLRGEQTTLCKSLIEVYDFKLKMYGESKVIFNTVDFKEFDVAIYGEIELEIKSGTIIDQNITVHGEAIVNLIKVDNKTSKLKAYGEASFKIQSSERIKFTAYGEAKLHYKGNATVKKGLSFGDTIITQID